MSDKERIGENESLIPLVVDCPNCSTTQAVTINLSNGSPLHGDLLQFGEQCVNLECSIWYTITYDPQTDKVNVS